MKFNLDTKLSYQTLNMIFSMLSERSDAVLYIINKDMSKQIYLNEAFETICGISREVFFKDMSQFYQCIPNDEQEKVMALNHQRVNGELKNSQRVIYHLQNSTGRIQALDDICFNLCDARGKIKAIGGIVKPITETEFQQYQSGQLINEFALEHYIKADISGALQEAFGVNSILPGDELDILPEFYLIINSTDVIKLTKREAQTLQCIAMGVHTKRVADQLHISTRTVELNLDNIRKKTGARTRVALLSQIENMGQVLAWSFG